MVAEKTKDHVKAFSASGELRVPVDGIRPNRQVRVQTNFDEPGYYTLQFGIAPGASPIPVSIFCQAEILWSVQGNFVRRLINVYNGTAISGAGEGVLAIVRDSSIGITTPTTANPKYVATVNLVKGNRPNMASSQPPLFTPRDILTVSGHTGPPPYILINNLDTVDIPIPQNAGVNAVLLYVTASPVAPATQAAILNNNAIDVSFADTSLLNTIGVANYDPCNRFQVIPPGSAVMTVTRRQPGTDQILVTPIFGIEG